MKQRKICDKYMQQRYTMKICNRDMQRPYVRQHVFLAGWGSFEASILKVFHWLVTREGFPSTLSKYPFNPPKILPLSIFSVSAPVSCPAARCYSFLGGHTGWCTPSQNYRAPFFLKPMLSYTMLWVHLAL